MTCKHDQTYTHDTETVNFLSKASCARGEMWSLHERRLLLIIFWKAACVSVTPYLVQLTFSLEACSWKNGDLVFQCLSFSQLSDESEEEVIDDPYVKKPRWRRKWNAISKMIKNGLAEGMVTRKLCVWRFWTSFWPRFRPRFFSTNRLKSPNHWHVVT